MVMTKEPTLGDLKRAIKHECRLAGQCLEKHTEEFMCGKCTWADYMALSDKVEDARMEVARLRKALNEHRPAGLFAWN